MKPFLLALWLAAVPISCPQRAASQLTSTSSRRGNSPPLAAQSQAPNANPNYAKIREYGSIEWRDGQARLIAGGSRPLDMVAQTLSSCLFLSVSAEDTHYEWVGDLLDVTSPQWAAQHPSAHAYASKPASVNEPFEVDAEGMPRNLHQLLEDAIDQVNQQQPWRFRLEQDLRQGKRFYAFVPTARHDESGRLVDTPAWLDQRVSIPQQKAPVMNITSLLTIALTHQTGYHFDCCQSLVLGGFWGTVPLHYSATNESARHILEDMLIAGAGSTSYVLRCDPMGTRSCFISVTSMQNGIPPTAPQSGRCSVFGYQAD